MRYNSSGLAARRSSARVESKALSRDRDAHLDDAEYHYDEAVTLSGGDAAKRGRHHSALQGRATRDTDTGSTALRRTSDRFSSHYVCTLVSPIIDLGTSRVARLWRVSGPMARYDQSPHDVTVHPRCHSNASTPRVHATTQHQQAHKSWRSAIGHDGTLVGPVPCGRGRGCLSHFSFSQFF